MRRHRKVVAAGVLAATAFTAASVPATSQADTDNPNFLVGAVRLEGAQEPDGGDEDGRGIFVYIAVDDTLCYLLTARKIETPTAAHIHDADPGVNGPIVIGLITPTDPVVADCIDAVPDTTPNGPDVLLRSELDAIVAQPSGFYVNVHNALFPVGAIRAQLR